MVCALKAFITFVDAKVVPLVPAPYNPRTYIDADIPGFGLGVQEEAMVCCNHRLLESHAP